MSIESPLTWRIESGKEVEVRLKKERVAEGCKPKPQVDPYWKSKNSTFLRLTHLG